MGATSTTRADRAGAAFLLPGFPQAALALVFITVGIAGGHHHGEPSAWWWLVSLLVPALIAALPSFVHDLRDPAHGPARSAPRLSARTNEVATRVALVASMVFSVVTIVAKSGTLAVGFLLLPFLLLASHLGLCWLGALSRSIAASRPHRGARAYRVVGLDPESGTLSLENGHGARIVARWPHHDVLPLTIGTDVRARIETRGGEAPYRDALPVVASLETRAHHRLRLRDRAGIAFGLLRALIWAALPFAVFLHDLIGATVCHP